MTATDLTSDVGDCGGDVAAYALGALAPAEADAFRAHVQSCIVCRDELEAFQQVVDVLPTTAAQRPAPKRVRRRVLDAVEHEPSAQPGGGRLLRPRRRVGGLSLRRPALALSAALVIVAVAIAGIELGSSAATRARVLAAHVTGPGRAEITESGGRTELVVHHLPAPPVGQIYEVWLVRPGRAPAATNALFSVTAKGDGDVAIPGNLQGVSAVMVTPEPTGGSRLPTHPAVIRARLS